MRKQSGFTLIELMVVMAIIAILATAGLSAYGGYIKKARDSTRIADLRAIETIIQGSLSVNGSAPIRTALITQIQAINNGSIKDPLFDGTNNKNVCLYEDNSGGGPCQYLYSSCLNGGYVLRARFESQSNTPRYAPGQDPLQNDITNTINYVNYYDVGNCTGLDTVNDSEGQI